MKSRGPLGPDFELEVLWAFWLYPSGPSLLNGFSLKPSSIAYEENWPKGPLSVTQTSILRVYSKLSLLMFISTVITDEGDTWSTDYQMHRLLKSVLLMINMIALLIIKSITDEQIDSDDQGGHVFWSSIQTYPWKTTRSLSTSNWSSMYNLDHSIQWFWWFSIKLFSGSSEGAWFEGWLKWWFWGWLNYWKGIWAE